MIFPYQILDETAHRPWPMPDAPWIMTQTWHDLMFAHWPIAPEVLQARVPKALPLDCFQGQAWIGVVPFHITNLAPRGVPSLPFVSSFAELNVRTYVTIDGKPGVYFFSLDAGSSIAVAGARALFHLPYFTATMQFTITGESVRYSSTRDAGTPEARFEATYRPLGPVQPPVAGTLEHFLTERYCLYTIDGSGRVRRLQIHHPPWPLLHFSKRQDMVGWGLEIVNGES